MRPKVKFMVKTINARFGEESTVYGEQCTTCTLKHGGGFLMFWGYMSYKSTGIFTKIDDNLHSSVWKLRTGSTWTFQRDNDSKHKAKSTIHRTEEEEKKSEGSGVGTTIFWPQYHCASQGKYQMCTSCKTTGEFQRSNGFILSYSRRMDNSTL